MNNKLNFDVKEMIDAFDFEEFLNTKDRDVCAFLLITNSQVLLGYTRGYGVGEHIFSFASVINEVMDNHPFDNLGDLYYLNHITDNTYIKARLVNHKWGDNEREKFMIFETSGLKRSLFLTCFSSFMPR